MRDPVTPAIRAAPDQIAAERAGLLELIAVVRGDNKAYCIVDEADSSNRPRSATIMRRPPSGSRRSSHTLRGLDPANRLGDHCTRREVCSAVENNCWSAVVILSLADTVWTSAAPLVPGEAHFCSAVST